jgi:hypothetical protein
MIRFPTIRSLCWKLCCGGLSCINLLLAAVALLQGGILVYNAFGRSIRLPDNIPRFAIEKTLPEQLHATWKSAYFDLGGGCLFKGIEIRQRSDDELLLSADILRVNLALPNLFLRTGLPLEELEIASATAYLPPLISPSGTQQAVLEVNDAHLSFNAQTLVIESLNGFSHDVHLIVEGSLPLSLLQPSSNAGARPLLAQVTDFDKKMRGLQNLQATIVLSAHIAGGTDAVVAVRGTHSGQSEFGNIDYAAKFNAQLMQDKSISIGHVEGQLTVSKLIDLPPFLQNSLGTFRTPLNVRFHAEGASQHALPASWSLFVATPFSEKLLSGLYLKASLPFEQNSLEWRLFGPSLSATGSLELDWNEGTPFPTSLTAHAAIANPNLLAWLGDRSSHRLLKNTSIGSANTRLQWTAKEAVWKAQATLRDIDFNEAYLPEVQLQVSLSTARLRLDLESLRFSPQETLRGLYEQDLASGRFAFYGQGDIYPRSLDYFLGEWWIAIFRELEINAPVQADVALGGTVGNPRSISSVVQVYSNATSYRKIPVPDLQLLIRSNPQWSFIESLNAHFDDASITGQIAWQQGFPGDVRRPMRLSLQSNAPWEIVQQASGVSALKEIQMDTAPKVVIDGWIWRPPRDNRPLGAIPQLEFAMSLPKGSLFYKNMSFSAVQARGSVLDKSVTVEPLTCTFAGGILTGSLDIEPAALPKTTSTLLNLQLIDAGFLKSMEQLGHLTQDPDKFVRNFARVGAEGRMDATLSLKVSQNTIDWAGAGHLSFRRAKLGQIHLLGGLSKLLQSIGLGFTSLDLNNGYVDWTIANDTLNVSNSLFTGTLLGLRMNGDLDMHSRALQMQADLNLLQGVLSKLLTPVSDNIQLELGGTLDTPNWSFRLSPLRWFTNRISDSLSQQP